MSKFLSRKFITAVAVFGAAILAASGVIDPTQEELFATSVVGAVYIVIEGLIDARRVS